MFNRTPKTPVAHELDQAITDSISEFQGSDTGSEEQLQLAGIIKTLMETRAADKAAVKPLVSSDAIASIAGNLLGIGLILGFEKANVITSKSLSFVPKIKI